MEDNNILNDKVIKNNECLHVSEDGMIEANDTVADNNLKVENTIENSVIESNVNPDIVMPMEGVQGSDVTSAVDQVNITNQGIEANEVYNFECNDLQQGCLVSEPSVEQTAGGTPLGRLRIRRIFAKLLASVLCGGVFGAAFLCVNIYGARVFGVNMVPNNEVISSTVTMAQSMGGVETDVTLVASNAMPSIVSITSLSVQEVMSFFGGSRYYESESAGSGIIIGMNEEELLILTNNHVVESSTTLTVTLVDEESVEATVKGTNAGQDIAVISVKLDDLKEESKTAIKIATLGDSGELKAGEPVIAIGNALGYGQSVTTGVVSALGRTVDGIDGLLIQTDTAINPGNSGGALLNAKGEVIGINTAKVSQSAVEGMGYAIPITDATETIEDLMNRVTKTVVSEEKRGYLGIQGVNVTEDTSELYHMPVGVYIAEVLEGSAAEKAGISKGSIITSLDGVKVENMEGLQEEVSYCAIGDEVKVVLQVPETNGEYTEVEIMVTMSKMAE